MWTNQYSMMDEFNYGTSLNSSDDIVLTWVFMTNHVEETTDKRTTWRPRKSPAWRRCQALFNLSNRCYRDKMEEGHGWSLKDHGNSMRVPIMRGANVQSVCKHVIALDSMYGPKKQDSSSLGREDYMDVVDENRTVVCGGYLFSTLIVVDNGCTPALS
jgi:hypothetical protein